MAEISDLEEIRAQLILKQVRGLGVRKNKLLIDAFGSAQAVLKASPEALQQEVSRLGGFGAKLQQALQALGNAEEKAADKELHQAKQLGVTLLPYASPHYPKVLKTIDDPPAILYVQGELPPTVLTEVHEVRTLGVVGTRNASGYALGLTRTWANQLAAQGVVIVSGLALGIDGAAHEGALSAYGGQTVAVLGAGLDTIYPPKHAGLAKRICKGGGALVSEYRIGTAPRAQHFPARNRIIAGLSRGVLVMEGSKTSGAIITADLALDYGRTVMALPGRVGDEAAVGALTLLKQGAGLVMSCEDIVQELQWQSPVRPSQVVQTPLLAPQARASVPLPALPEGAEPVMEALRVQPPPLLDDLMAHTGQTAAELLPLLMRLELQGVIKHLPSDRYELCT